MGKFVDMFTVVAVLIGIYLFVANGSNTVKIISTLSTNATAGIKTLQGR